MKNYKKIVKDILLDCEVFNNFKIVEEFLNNYDETELFEMFKNYNLRTLSQIQIINSLYEKIESIFLLNFKEIREVEINLFNESELIKIIEFIINRIINSFLSKIGIEENTFIENNIILFMLEQCCASFSKQEALKNITISLFSILDGLYSWVLTMQLEWYAKDYLNNIPEIDKTISLLFDNDKPKLLKVITSSFLKIFQEPNVFYKPSLLKIVMEKLDFLLSRSVGQFNVDIFSLVILGKKVVSEILLKKLSDKQLNYFWDNKLLTKVILGNKKFYFTEEPVYEKLFLIYIGFAEKKQIKCNIKSKLNIFLENNLKVLENNSFCAFEIQEKFHWILNLLKNNEKNNFDYISNSNENNFELLMANMHKNIENVQLWFDELIKNFCKNNGIKNNEQIIFKTLDLDNQFSIYTLFLNKENLDEKSLEIIAYSFIKLSDFSKIEKLKNRNFSSLSNFEIKSLEDQCKIKTKIDKEKSLVHIKNIYKNFLNDSEMNEVDPISLVDNSLLSAVDCYKFSHYEFLGDLLYSIIIKDLYLDGELNVYKNINDFKNHKIQNEICKSLKFEENIQEGNNYFFQKNEIQSADYFEVFIYMIYKIKGYKSAKDTLRTLIFINRKDLMFDNKKWIHYEFELDNLNSKHNLCANFSSFTKLELICYRLNFSQEFKESTNKIIHELEEFPKEIICEYIKLMILTNKKLEDKILIKANINIYINYSSWLNMNSTEIFEEIIYNAFPITLQQQSWAPKLRMYIANKNLTLIMSRWIELFMEDNNKFEKTLFKVIENIVDKKNNINNN